MPVPINFPSPPLLTEAQFLAVVPGLAALAADNDRWRLDGVTWSSRSCEDLAGASDIGCDATTLNKLATETRGAEDYPAQPVQLGFLVWDAIRCSTLSNDYERMVAEGAEKFALWVGSVIAEEAITAAASTGAGLASSATVLAGQNTVVAAVGRLEQWLGTVIGNGRGYLHMSQLVLAHAVAEGVVEMRDGGYRTPSGHVVVADAGYQHAVMVPDGEPAPIADEPWIFATGPVFVRATTPEPLTNYAHEAILFSENVIDVITEAYAIVVFEPCAVAATQVLLEAPVGS